MGDSRTFDYAIDSAGSSSDKREGFFGNRGEVELTTSARDETDPLGISYLTEVVVRRLGNGTFPIEVLMVFEDGSEVRQSWDGRSQRKKFSHRGQSKLDHAVVDPERVLLLDLNYTNNSRSADEGDRWPAAKWAAKWIAWLQEVLHAFAFFV